MRERERGERDIEKERDRERDSMRERESVRFGERERELSILIGIVFVCASASDY